MAAPAAPQGRDTGRMPRGGGAPQGQKKDNTPMIIGGVSVGILVLGGLGFAMMGHKDPPKKKEPPKVEVKKEEPPKPYDEWNDPAKLGSVTDAAKRRQAGMNEQNKSGEVDHPKGTEGGK